MPAIEYGVSSGDDENVLRLDSGNSCTTLSMLKKKAIKLYMLDKLYGKEIISQESYFFKNLVLINSVPRNDKIGEESNKYKASVDFS